VSFAGGGPGGGDAGDALADARAVETGDGGQDLQQHLAGGGAGVDRVAEADEADSGRFKVGTHLEQMQRRAPEAVQLRDDEDVEVAGQRQQPGELGRSSRRPDTPASMNVPACSQPWAWMCAST
jgi:hypothetical protein